MRRLFLLIFLTTVAFTFFSQERDYILEAKQAFHNSEYVKAANLYKIAYAMTGIETSAEQKLCNECAETQRTAREYANTDDNEKAKIWYEKILEKNPNDSEAKAFLSRYSEQNKINGHEYVDLGLPSGLKWAICNVGASSPSDYGNYYAWGEIKPKSIYTRSNYFDHLKGYAFGVYKLGGKTQIAPTSGHDTARENWGGTWRMPTLAELKELNDKCTWEWTKTDDHKGYKVTGPNGKSLFLPAAGFRLEKKVDEGESGCYWSSTLSDFSDRASLSLFFSNIEHAVKGGDIEQASVSPREFGMSVRPVSE